MFARKIEKDPDTIPGWCRDALSLDRIERLGAHGCFWLVFFDNAGCIVHAAGSLPGALHPLCALVGKCRDDLPDTPAGDERRAVFDEIIAAAGTDVLVIDVWRGLEVWWLCGVECNLEQRSGVLAIGFRPSIEQEIPEETIVRRLRFVSDPGPLADLSIGELEVLRLLALGFTREEMSHEVHRTVKAVERRRTMLGKKLGLDSSHMLTLIGLRAGLHRFSETELEKFWRLNCAKHRRRTSRPSD